jgi:hypothetical protein
LNLRLVREFNHNRKALSVFEAGGPAPLTTHYQMVVVAIAFGCPAERNRSGLEWPSLEARRLATGDAICAHPIFHGTLADCVKQFMLKPISQRPLYEIFTDRQPGLRDSILGPNAILQITKREDFPKD